jgi:protein tyrosine phosphatase (PTP) superfamily phosphohydrolase (DUF442 family)
MAPLHHAAARRLVAALVLLAVAPKFARAQPPASSLQPPASKLQPPASAAPELENLHRLSATLLSGSEPKTDAAFAELAAMGVRTVVSVDGIKPNLAAAAKHGLRYIHIPIGYDGVDAHAQAALTRLVREAKAPAYVHCHHGKHRGPAAAAVACMAAGDMDHASAAAYLKLAGTGREYAGLWRDVAGFQPLPADAPLPPLVEAVEVEGLSAAMAQLDRAWDGLQRCEAAGWKTPPDHRDLTPVHQALLVWEGLREAERANDHADPQLAAWLRAEAGRAEQLHQSLQASRLDAATAAFQNLEAGCAQCHKQYRN